MNNIIIYDLDIIIYDLDADLTNTNCSQRGRFRPPPPKKGLCERSLLEYKENLQGGAEEGEGYARGGSPNQVSAGLIEVSYVFYAPWIPRRAICL